MALKKGIVAEIGQGSLLLPERIAEVLTTYDQIKYCFALLQMARANADKPAVPVQDLKAERVASGIDDTSLDEVVAAARREGKGSYSIPQACTIE